MHKFAVDKASNGYVLWINYSDNAELLGPHVFLNKVDMMKFIEQHLI